MQEILEKLETELKLRGFSERTIKTYILQNKKFLEFLAEKKPKAEGFQSTLLDSPGHRSFQNVNKSDLKAYIAFLMSDRKQKPSSINLAIAALKFVYDEMLKKDLFKDIKKPKPEKKLPVVLTKDEVKKLIDSTENAKHKLLIELMYGSGLRVSEIVNLKINDIDLNEGVGLVRASKGKKDRNMIIPRKLSVTIRNYLASREDQSEYLFNVSDRGMSIRQAQKIVKDSARKAGIRKRVFCHCLRSSFATHLLEAGTDIRIIQELLGHADLGTTQIYTKVTTERIKKVKSPFDSL